MYRLKLTFNEEVLHGKVGGGGKGGQYHVYVHHQPGSLLNLKIII